MHFNMTPKAFHQKCWNLNKPGVFADGSSNLMVNYKDMDLIQLGWMKFYPTYENYNIGGMTGFSSYDAWALWNRELFAESLINQVKDLFRSWCGGKSFEVKPTSIF